MPTSPLGFGDPAPWFFCRTESNPSYVFDTVAGRFVVLSLFESAAQPQVQEFLACIMADGDRFDDSNLCFFGVSADVEDDIQKRVSNRLPGIRFIWDDDRAVSSLYGAHVDGNAYRNMTYLLDPMLRVVANLPFDGSGSEHFLALRTLLSQLPPIGEDFPALLQAPVLVIPRVFEPEFCARLIAYYDSNGGEDSGFMRDVNGKTVKIIDHGHKRRRDCTVEDEMLRTECMHRIHDHLAPQIQRAFQFNPTRMERYIIACYEDAESGHFRQHRDNTTKGTAHRRFAVSLFLNSGEYEGGYLRFPEFGPGQYTAPTGGAVIFSCSLLHEATPVTRGRRMMFLPFLYDELARRVREQNLQFLDEQIANADFRGTAE